MTEELLHIDDLIRHVSRGLPLPLEAEHVRLPRFTRSIRMTPEELGLKGADPLIVCLSRTTTYIFWCVPGKAKFGTKDADRVLKQADAVQAKFPEKPLKGYVVTAMRPDAAAAAKLAKAGHLVSALTDTPPPATSAVVVTA